MYQSDPSIEFLIKTEGILAYPPLISADKKNKFLYITLGPVFPAIPRPAM